MENNSLQSRFIQRKTILAVGEFYDEQARTVTLQYMCFAEF